MSSNIHKNFKKKFKKLPKNIQQKFYNCLELLLINEFDKKLNNHSVQETFTDCRSINVARDYRALFKKESDSIIFMNIGTHSDLY